MHRQWALCWRYSRNRYSGGNSPDPHPASCGPPPVCLFEFASATDARIQLMSMANGQPKLSPSVLTNSCRRRSKRPWQ